MTSLPSWSILTSSWMSHSGLSLLPLPLLFLCSRSLSLSLALALHSSLVHTVGCLGAVRLIRKMTKHTEYHVPYNESRYHDPSNMISLLCIQPSSSFTTTDANPLNLWVVVQFLLINVRCPALYTTVDGKKKWGEDTKDLNAPATCTWLTWRLNTRLLSGWPECRTLKSP